MTLYLIGLGLGSEQDITLRGLAIAKEAAIVFLEHYTSILGVEKERLEELFGREVLLADRTLVEQDARERLIEPAKEEAVALLVVGDPLGATTHSDLILRCDEAGVKVEIINNASVMNAIGVVGLELYKYGSTTSIPYWEKGYEPETPYDAIKQNYERGLHTLCLLDIKVKEQSREDLRRGTSADDSKPRYMTIREGLEILLEIARRRGDSVFSEDSLVVGVARLGQEGAEIRAGSVRELLDHDFAGPLHSLIVPGRLHVVEEEMLSRYH